jgi:osmoprotectant transport system permease protein
MAGVRIASVTAVGLMTMAAFIGAGGLGYLVFSGIRTVNNSQILAGAIPACLLALLVDYLIGLVEKLVTPMNLQKGDGALKQKRRVMQKAGLSAAALILAGIFLFTSTGGRVESARSISIGSKDFTEQEILGNMMADLIEDRTDISVNRRLNLGGTQVCFEALKNGDIDLYIEYSGTAYTDMLKHPPINDMNQVYETVNTELKENYDINVLKQMNFNNTYVLAVTQETAKKFGFESISDLAKEAGGLTSGLTFEFTNREDGLTGLQKTYDFQIGQNITLDNAPRYTALQKGTVDVIDAFATDGLLKKFDLKSLVDDQEFFPPYFAMPIIRGESLEKYPEISAILEELGPLLTDEIMRELNYKVDELQQTPSKVAHEFLKENKLIS